MKLLLGDKEFEIRTFQSLKFCLNHFRPPLPMENMPPPRPPMPSGPPAPADTDDEEGLFTNEPRSNRPIHLAAHGLYQEVKQVSRVVHESRLDKLQHPCTIDSDLKH